MPSATSLPSRVPQPFPAALLAASGAGRSADPRRLCPPSRCLSQGKRCPGQGRWGGGGKPASSRRQNPEHRAGGGGGRRDLLEAPQAKARPLPLPGRRLLGERLTRPSPGRQGDTRPTCWHGRGSAGPACPGPPLPLAAPAPLSSPAGLPPTRARRGAKAGPGGPAPPAAAAAPASPSPPEKGGVSPPRERKAAHPAVEGKSPQAWFLLHRRSLPAGPRPPGRGFRLPAAAKSSGLASLKSAEQRWRRTDSQPCLNGRRHLGHRSARGTGGGPQRTDTHRYLVTSARPMPFRVAHAPPAPVLPALPFAPPRRGGRGAAETPNPSVHCARSAARPGPAGAQCLLGTVVFQAGHRPAP